MFIKFVADGSANQALITNGSGVLSFAAVGASAGQVIQVLSATDSTQRTTSSATFVTASNTMSVSITPSSASNKVYVIASGNLYINSGGVYAQATIFRNSTNLGASDGMTNSYDGNNDHGSSLCVSVLDSPNTTSAITYQVYFKTNGVAIAAINQNSNCQGSITCFEIKG